MRYQPWPAVLVCLIVLIAGDLAAAQPTSGPAVTGRRVASLDRGWLFHLGDVPFPVVTGHGMSYGNAKAGNAFGAAAMDFDDTAWRTLDLPHDWAVEGPFDPKENVSQGYRPRGIGWYRRHFKVPAADRGKHIEIQIDGVATHCTVWVNGSVAHRNFCGYTSFYIDITPFARYGNEVNTIAVRVDANEQEGWWYEGAGMYRHTWLVTREPVHIATDGVFAHPVRQPDGAWTVPVEVTLNSADKADATVRVETALIDPDGKEVARGGYDAAVGALGDAVARYAIPVTGPRLWSVDEPTLYRCVTTVTRDGLEVDRLTTACGFRTIRFDTQNGFFLNDRPLKLQGVCNHQDHAGVGVAVPDSIWDFRLRRLKKMGVNAYRCAHNPPAKEFLDACDRAGILVMDENRNFNTAPEYMRQLEWMVRRDRNHPSIILWSVFNEEPMQGTSQGYEMVRRMSAAVKKLDPTRPVTAAQNGALTTEPNASMAADVAGINYQHNQYDAFHNRFPDKPVTSSEDTSGFMTRGEYVTDKSKFIIDSYDTQAADWGRTHRDSWKRIAERKFLAGGFVWTGFDYRGEPTPHAWPAASSFFGIMDLCGFPKSAFWMHQAHWIKDKPVLQLIPHWNWAGQEGKPIKVMALTNAESVELILNGQSLGSKPVDPFMFVEWQVPYAAGRLEAIGTRGGREIARHAVETTGAPVALRLVPDRAELAGDTLDAMPVTVQAIDDKGRPVPIANSAVTFEISGGAAIIGLGNGDPLDHDPEMGNKRRLFNGLAQVILQSNRAGPGSLTLKATADGLNAAELSLPIAGREAPLEVPATRTAQSVGRWRISPLSAERPDPNQTIAASDQNTWSPVSANRTQTFEAGGYVIYRATFTPRAAVRKSGGRLTLPGLTGAAEVWIDGRKVGERAAADRGELVCDVPAGDGERTLSVLIRAEPRARVGLGGNVTVEPAATP
ncbi:MAG TPA: beta-galactosidase GalA [Tepidisphaeraceae bacterium]|jgi:beta-galactosidase